jgi:hypothetical protein
MPRLKDIVSGLSKQTAQAQEELKKARDERARLRDAAIRFRDLGELIKTKDESYKIGIALLSALSPKVSPEAANFVFSIGGSDWEEAGISVDGDDLDIANYPLWKVIEQVLRQSSEEMRVFELEESLKSFGVKAERSAIESALATHKKEFKTTKRGREKFVSLK